MKLDNEPQRQQLLQIISSLPINGNLEQVTQAANVLHSLGQAVRDAGIEEPGPPTDLCSNIKKEE
jgi:predicted RNase H-like nuclease (RuvC/YqgF family)